MRQNAQGLMPRAHHARGEVRGALPRTPARGIPPETPGPLSLLPHVPERSSPSRVRCAEQKTLALDGSGPFRRLAPKKEKAANAKAKPSQLAALHGLPLVGQELLNNFRVDKTS